MNQIHLGAVESRFAKIIWDNAPLTTLQLVELCNQALDWKRTTTYTVLKKLCDRGIFKTEKSLVTVLIPEEKFHAMQSEQFVSETFGGSLPAFLAAFTSRQKLSEKDLAEIRQLLDSFEGE